MADTSLENLPAVATLDDLSLVYSANWNGLSYDDVKITYGDLSSQVSNSITLSNILNNSNDADGLPITNLGLPVSTGDAANKSYVDVSIASRATLKNRVPSGNLAQNPWQNGDSITGAFDQNINQRCADRWFSIRESSVAGSAATVDKSNYSPADPSVSRNNVSLKVTSTAIVPQAAAERASLFTRINGIDLGGLEGGGAGHIILSFTAFSSNTPGVYSIGFSHPNGGIPLNYFREFTVTATPTFFSFSIPTPPVSPADFLQFNTSSSMSLSIFLSGGADYQGTEDLWVANGPTVSTSQNNFFDQVGNEIDFSDISFCKGMIDLPAIDVYQVTCSCSDEVIDHCLHYYQKSYGRGDVGGDITAEGALISPGLGAGALEPKIAGNVILSQSIINVPTVSLYNPNTGVVDEWGLYDMAPPGEPALLAWANEEGFAIINVPGFSFNDVYHIHWVADADV